MVTTVTVTVLLLELVSLGECLVSVAEKFLKIIFCIKKENLEETKIVCNFALQ